MELSSDEASCGFGLAWPGAAVLAASAAGLHTAKKVGKIDGKQIDYVKHAANRCLLFEVIGYQCSGRQFVAN